jgi:hypothetical protein
MALFPIRVRRGTTGSDWYYADGVNPMTELTNGFGEILRDNFGVGQVSLSTSDFDVMQAELTGRLIGFGGVEGSGLALNETYLQAVANAVNSP